jgi:hypothetical protein
VEAQLSVDGHATGRGPQRREGLSCLRNIAGRGRHHDPEATPTANSTIALTKSEGHAAISQSRRA